MLTAIWLPAAGATRVSDSVHSRFDSMAARIAGLTKKPSSTGFRAVSTNPRIEPPQKSTVARRIGRAAWRTRAGQVSRQNSNQPLDLARPA